jgi:hypothetical protein
LSAFLPDNTGLANSVRLQSVGGIDGPYRIGGLLLYYWDQHIDRNLELTKRVDWDLRKVHSLRVEVRVALQIDRVAIALIAVVRRRGGSGIAVIGVAIVASAVTGIAITRASGIAVGIATVGAGGAVASSAVAGTAITRARRVAAGIATSVAAVGAGGVAAGIATSVAAVGAGGIAVGIATSVAAVGAGGIAVGIATGVATVGAGGVTAGIAITRARRVVAVVTRVGAGIALACATATIVEAYAINDRTRDILPMNKMGRALHNLDIDARCKTRPLVSMGVAR